jgi:DNA-binding NtrC family response regulator
MNPLWKPSRNVLVAVFLAFLVQGVLLALYLNSRPIIPEDPRRSYPWVASTRQLPEGVAILGSGALLWGEREYIIGWKWRQNDIALILFDRDGRYVKEESLPGNIDPASLKMEDLNHDGGVELMYTRVWPHPRYGRVVGEPIDSVWVCTWNKMVGEQIMERVSPDVLQSQGHETIFDVDIRFPDRYHEIGPPPSLFSLFVEVHTNRRVTRHLSTFVYDRYPLRLSQFSVAQRIDEVLWWSGDQGQPLMVLGGEFTGDTFEVDLYRADRDQGITVKDDVAQLLCLDIEGDVWWRHVLGGEGWASVHPGRLADREIILARRDSDKSYGELQTFKIENGEPRNTHQYYLGKSAFVDSDSRSRGQKVHLLLRDFDGKTLSFLGHDLTSRKTLKISSDLPDYPETLHAFGMGRHTSLPVEYAGGARTLIIDEEGTVQAYVVGKVLPLTFGDIGDDFPMLVLENNSRQWLCELRPNSFPLWWFWPNRGVFATILFSNILVFLTLYSLWLYRTTVSTVRKQKELENVLRGGMEGRVGEGKELAERLYNELSETRSLGALLEQVVKSLDVAAVVLDLSGVVQKMYGPVRSVLAAAVTEGGSFKKLFREEDALSEALQQVPVHGRHELTLSFQDIRGTFGTVQTVLVPLAANEFEAPGWLALLKIPGGRMHGERDGERDRIHGDQRYGMVGASLPMISLFRQIEDMADSNATVLIEGDSGTGKELVAKALHEHSSRAKGPFIKVNCAALSETLLESELFGHVKGAFTGAYRSRTGRFEAARGGTILLDEIGELPLSLQTKLLRVLQEREVERVGEQKPVPLDVRVLASTNQNLQQAISEGQFREDLYFRLNVLRIETPPLEERKSDIPLLVAHILGELSDRLGRRAPSVEPDALEALTRYHWPGNVRELENCVERALILSRDGRMRLSHLPPEIQSDADEKHPQRKPQSSSARANGSDDEREELMRDLTRHEWNVSRVASERKVSRMTIYRKIKSYHLERPDSSQESKP